MCTPGLQPALERLASLTCTHRTHDDNVGGSLDGDNWRSASHSAYPPDLNMLIAKAVASRISLTAAKRQTQTSPPLAATRAVLPVTTPHTHSSSVEGVAGTTSDAQPAQTSDTRRESDNELNQHFQRGLAAYPLRSRTPAALLTVRDVVQAPSDAGCLDSNSALLASVAYTDPKTRKQALRDDREGWTAAERAEIANHANNGSWEVIDRSSVPAGRALVRLIWVYKRKRSRSLKARLCVQGCAQIPGVDFEQTFCATMRATSLR
eukprot:4237774-Pleurochrysis_carterae.AAC.1